MCVHSQSCLTLYDPTASSPADSSVHGIFQARRVGWAATSSSAGSLTPGSNLLSCIGRWILYHWTSNAKPHVHDCSWFEKQGRVNSAKYWGSRAPEALIWVHFCSQLEAGWAMEAEGRTSVKLVKEKRARRSRVRTNWRKGPSQGALPWLETESSLLTRGSCSLPWTPWPSPSWIC